MGEPQLVSLLPVPTGQTSLMIATLYDDDVQIGREWVACLATIAGSATAEPMIVDGARLVLWTESRHHRAGSVGVFSRGEWGGPASMWDLLDLAEAARNEGWPASAIKELEARAREAEDRQHKL